jgi:WD40 repeat protein
MDGNVLVFDMRVGGKRATSKYCGWRYGATQVKYNRQNPNELASSHGGSVYVWDDRKGSSPVTVITAHAQKIYGIDYSRKRKDSIVTCSLDSTVKVRRATDTRYAKAECYHSTGLSMALPK